MHNSSQNHAEVANAKNGNVQVLMFIEQYGAKLKTAGYSDKDSLNIVGILMDTTVPGAMPPLPSEPTAVPTEVESYTPSEVNFMLTVALRPGAELAGEPIVQNVEWIMPESRGMVRCVGSYQWIPTEKLMRVIRAAFSADPGASSKPA